MMLTVQDGMPFKAVGRAKARSAAPPSIHTAVYPGLSLRGGPEGGIVLLKLGRAACRL
jgi:hypothetical protein